MRLRAGAQRISRALPDNGVENRCFLNHKSEKVNAKCGNNTEPDSCHCPRSTYLIKAVCAFALILQVAGPLRAVRGDVLLVTREGAGIWARSVRRDGDSVAYIDRESGAEKRIPQAGLDGIVYPVQRGKQYAAEDVEKKIETIRRLMGRHQALTRPLNEMLQQWEALTRPLPELDTAVKAVSEAFDAGARDARAYRKACIDLDMLAYKDVNGSCVGKIRAEKERIRRDYVEVNIARLQQMAGRGATTPESFVAMKRIAGPLEDSAQETDRAGISAIMSAARQDAMASGFRQVDALSAQGISLNFYLRCSSLLLLLKDEVAGGAAEKAEAEKRLVALRAHAASRLADYFFSGEGFPLAKEDREAAERAARFSARVTFKSRPLEERAMLIPLASPGNISLGAHFRIPFRAVFNSIPATNCVYGLTILIPGARIAHEHTRRLPCFSLSGARADFELEEDFSSLPADFEPGADRQGRCWVYAVLSRLVSEPDAPQEEWLDVSRGCQLPLSGGRGY